MRDKPRRRSANSGLTNQQQEPEPTRLEIWVDDCKPAPNGCAVARTYDDALRMLRSFEYSKLYLDHDLGDSIYDKTGYDLLMVLIEEGRVPPVVECISWNPQETVLAAYAQGNGRPVPVRMNTGGVLKKSAALNDAQKPGEYWAGMLTAQGLPADFLSEAPFTVQGKKRAVGNGVPLPMGRAIAKAVKRAMYPEMLQDGAA